MEDVEEFDSAFSDETYDDDEAAWNEVHGSSSPPASMSTRFTPPLSRHGSAGLSDRGSHHSPRHPTPANRSYVSSTSVLHRSPSSQASSRAGTPLVTARSTLPILPSEVPADLQTTPLSDLQRLLLSNYKQLAKTMASIIDDPDQDRFFLDGARQLLASRIAGIEAAVEWRSSFETVNASGIGSPGLQTGPPAANQSAPMTPSTPGPSIVGQTKRGLKIDTNAVPNTHISSSPTILHTPSRAKPYPCLLSERLVSPSPGRPAGGVRSTTSRLGLVFGLDRNRATKSPDTEASDLESDDSDAAETAPSKLPSPAPSRLLEDRPDVNVTRRSPRKLRGIQVMPVPSGSGASSKAPLRHDVFGPVDLQFSPPSTNIATTSGYVTPLSPTGSMVSAREHFFDELDSELSIPTQVEEQFTSIYKDEIMDKLKTVFGLEAFRTNQAHAVDATMSGCDVFVRMPTGGGKRLCYQLPAVCTTGRTRGVTFVVSPPKSLMVDQVRQLRNKGVDVVVFNSDQYDLDATEARARLVTNRKKPSLVYVTPEELTSDDTRNILDNLMRQEQLARFVIDKAHCVSTWGGDFREAYQGLGFLRKSYPGIPIMALVATANPTVRAEVINKLGIVGCVELTQSFNRPNLHYEVRKKGRYAVSDIAKCIRAHHREQAGIIYCLSRDKCEEVAKKLRNEHISARHYHAAMATQDKNETQAAWISGRCNVIVAPIAFDMDIDKPDVRFVIHHQSPMSLFGYYQETGRAGRDGKPARCILYYAYADIRDMDRMIEQGSQDGWQPLSYEEQQRQKDDVREVVQYCRNMTECRRSQVLAYFSEQFNPVYCHKACDNCTNQSKRMRHEDMTDVACMVVEFIKSTAASPPTMKQAIDAFRGSKRKDIRDRGWDSLPMSGKGSHLERNLTERVFLQLVAANALDEELDENKRGVSDPFLVLGEYASDYIEGGKKFIISVGQSEKGKGKADPTTETVSASNKYQVPVTLASMAIPDSDIEDDLPNGGGFTGQFRKLKKLRDKIAKQFALEDPDDVFQEEVLQELALLEYNSEDEFKQALWSALGPQVDFEQKFEMFGKPFMDLCLKNATHSPQAKTPPAISSLVDRFQLLRAGPSASRVAQ